MRWAILSSGAALSLALAALAASSVLRSDSLAPVPPPKPSEEPAGECTPPAAPLVAPTAAAEPSPAKAVPEEPSAPPTGRLTLDTSPWTRVYVGRRSLGRTPILEAPLPVGRHRLRLRNAKAGIDRMLTVEVKPNATTVRRLRF